MSGIRISSKQVHGFTPISNTFIDRYMPDANGSYIKVYLYLLRRLHSNNEALSVLEIADHLEYTENDVLRALTYWQKKNLLEIQTNQEGQIDQIVLLDPEQGSNQTPSQTPKKESTQTYNTYVPVKTLPQRIDYTPEQISILTMDEDLRLLLDVLEQYMGGPLSQQNTQLVLYLYESVGFSSELILYLYEYCLSKDKRASSYIESVALAWAKQDIDTVEKAKATTIQYNATYTTIMKALGLNRLPAEIEKRYIDAWLSFGFELPVIVEACNRTILHTQKADFKYANGILENWKNQGVMTKDDVAKTDEAFQRKKTGAESIKVKHVNKKVSGQFGNFPQRQYSSEEYSAMEQQLLNKQ